MKIINFMQIITIIIINFSQGAYNIDDINDIINLELNEKYDFKIDKINIIIDVNQYSILIILEEGFTIILDENLKKLFGFSNGIINKSYTRLYNIFQIR